MVLAGSHSDLRKVLVCSSGYVPLDKAVDLTAEMSAKGRLEVAIVHVMAAPPAIYSHLSDDAEEDADSVLGSNSLLARNLRNDIGAMGMRGVAAKIRLRHGFVASEILREIETGGYDLVVVGSAPSQGALHTYVMGDVTSEVVNSASCAVLVVRGLPPNAPKGIWARMRGLFIK
jgi:nucleotide-binding universal stress UspA family protein